MFPLLMTLQKSGRNVALLFLIDGQNAVGNTAGEIDGEYEGLTIVEGYTIFEENVTVVAVVQSPFSTKLPTDVVQVTSVVIAEASPQTHSATT